ncbi:putative lipid-transfer protein DIR1 [Momordica charantia]|uniref:Lipid-transfer protein DIR1 n=1 Tax=Momordica charantia TaxID=3673 RepID=A0A6J1DS99_MOMCH|nr:putative lipid-transfer protein DIR1 [Momordica charantia]
MEMTRTVAALAVAVAVLVSLAGISGAVNVCGVDEDGLTACKPWVTKPCPTDPPPVACCNGLSKADFGCFCNYKNSLVLPSLGIEPNLALALPAKCGLPSAPPC